MYKLRFLNLTKNKHSNESRLREIFLITLFLSWIVLIIGFFYIQRASKSELANSLIESSREQLLVGDSRSAMVIFGKAIPKWFQSITLYKNSGEIVFSLQDDRCLACYSISEKIWFVENEKSFGYVRFSYSISGLIGRLLLSLAITSMIFFFLFKREERKVDLERETQRKIWSLEAENRIARQVSHDIRSPLSAIKMIASLPSLDSLEAKDILIRAADKIGMVAQDMINKSKRINGAFQREINISKVNISQLLENIIKEKQIEYRENGKAIIEFKSSLGECFAYLAVLEFQRMISNIINNGIEAAKDNEIIKINVSAFNRADSIMIVISDNGKGMPNSILQKLGKFEISYGKESMTSGLGIGVFQAFQTVREIKGEITYNSKQDEGTIVTINIPVAS